MLGCQHLLFTSYKILLDLYFTSSSEANHSSNESHVLIQLKSAILLQSCANPFLSTMLWTTICNIMHSFRCMGRIFTTKSSGFVHVCMPQCRCSLGDVFVFKLPTYCAIPPSPPIISAKLFAWDHRIIAVKVICTCAGQYAGILPLKSRVKCAVDEQLRPFLVLAQHLDLCVTIASSNTSRPRALLLPSPASIGRTPKLSYSEGRAATTST